MTSSSLKNHRIIRPSTRRWTLAEALSRSAVLVLAMLLTADYLPGAQADESEDDSEISSNVGQEAGNEVKAANPQSVPRIKVRSPQEKWKELHEEWLRSNSASTARRRRKDEPSSSLQRPVPKNPALLDAQTGLQDAPIEAPDAGEGDDSDQSDSEADPNKLKKISAIPPFFIPASEGQLPEEFTLGQTPLATREFSHSTFNWEASDLYHYPLYFEDPAFERYGHTLNPLIIEPLALMTKACLQDFAVKHPVLAKPFVWIANPMGDYPKPYFDPYMNVLQPLVSSTKFGCGFMLLPYKMTLDPIFSRNYALGYYQPGDVAPYKIYQFPLNADAALRQGAWIAGFYFGLPRP